MRTSSPLAYAQATRIWFIALVLSVLAGCADIRLVGTYDKQIDDGVTALQKSTETYLVKLTSGPGDKALPYKGNEAFYGETKVAVSSLRVRADATSRNSLTVRQLDTLQTNYDLFQKMHQDGISKAEIPLVRDGFNSQFTAILTFELAKRRTENPDESKAVAPPTPAKTPAK
ncbi:MULTISPECIES: hypothetical protein [unclassified Variovorax]|uniref:hypothetical protein n=1 Tax=unclassified Variovorax TaxID=663243 RepID=UPI001316078C|nr:MULTISPECIES: hypothetical protein [unclassified Variovorax]VTU42250.1 hypothetical protein SRS16P1_00223 [Variovorax sp. SRS16]VTU42275.1 hypothetical protein E5P1_00221 [Variovorax sp. PBL-E5]VTU44253.1 hypothetical protein H6P1_00710 [Variovorax sp. PBL-H6]